MNPPLKGFYLKQEHMAQMEAEADGKAPEEACGIIIGLRNRSHLVIPITNVLHSPTRFRMEPKEELDAFYLAENNRLDVLAIYHSHPSGPSYPSVTDYKELSFPGIIYLIWYKEFNRWYCRGFYMNSMDNAPEVPLNILST